MLIQYTCIGSSTLAYIVYFSNGTARTYVLGTNATSIPTPPLPLIAYAPIAQLILAIALLITVIALGGLRTTRLGVALLAVAGIAWSASTPLYVTASINCGGPVTVSVANPLFVYGVAAVVIFIIDFLFAAVAEFMDLRGGHA